MSRELRPYSKMRVHNGQGFGVVFNPIGYDGGWRVVDQYSHFHFGYKWLQTVTIYFLYTC